MFINLENNIQNIPILGPLILQLTNQAIWLVLLGGASVKWFESEDLALVGWLAFLIFAVLAGMRQWRDMRIAINNNRPQIEAVLTDTLHAAKFSVPYKGHSIVIDFPDDLEPGAARAIVDALLTVLPADESP